MLNIAIVEDDIKTAELLAEFCTRYANETEQAMTHNIFSNGMVFTAQYRPYDIILMDIQMPHMDGLETAKRIRKIDKKAGIIFVTNMAHYAIRGYEVNALDFIVKPVEYYNFAFKLKKAVLAAERSRTSEILITFDRGIRKIDVADIYYVENLRHRVLYHTSEGPFEEYASLSKVEKKLEKHEFVRCNSYYLVNLRHISEIRNASVIVAGKELQMSRAKRKELINELTLFVGKGGCAL